MRFSSIVIALALLAAFASDSWAQSQNPTTSPSETTKPQQAKPPTNDKAAQPDQKKADAPPVIVNVLPTPKTDHEAEEERQERKEKAELDRRLVALTGDLAFFTAGLFAATAALVLATAALAYYAFKQSRDMKASIKISEGAATTARDQVKLSREALISTERAFVFAQNVESFWTADKATETIIKWTFFVVWKNSGKTPTRKMASNINSWIGVDAGPLPVDFDFPDYGGAQRNMIGPATIMHGDRVDISVDQLQKIRAGTAHAYLWGWAEYSDVFAGTDRHRSEFCFEIIVTGNPSYKEGRFGFALHGPFNGYDEDCYRKPQS
jgi:hypothetical protein